MNEKKKKKIRCTLMAGKYKVTVERVNEIMRHQDAENVSGKEKKLSAFHFFGDSIRP